MVVQNKQIGCRLGRRPAIQGPRCSRQGTRASSVKYTTGTPHRQEFRIATINVRSLRNKEVELAEELEKYGVEVAGITETKRVKTGELNLNNNFKLIYSGNEEQAKEGVAIAFRTSLETRLIEWEAVSSRIMWAKFKMGEWTMKVICVYGPVEGSKKEEIEEFFELLDRVAETKGKEKIVIVGDLNSRVGNETNIYGDIVGKFGEKGKANNNGKKLLELCAGHGFVITNTIFQHKDDHKYTWREHKRNKKSIIDYIIVDSDLKQLVQDTRVYRGFEIGSDHNLVLSRIKIKNCLKRKRPKKVLKRIKTEKLLELTYSLKYKKVLLERANQIDMENASLEQEWQHFKRILVESAREVCGEVVCKDRKFRTPWWNQEVKEAIKEKKEYYKKFLANKSERSLMEYRDKCKRAKNCVKLAKEKSWEEFGENIEGKYQEGGKIFWRLVKNLRTGGKTTTKGIKNDEGVLQTEEEEILKVWSKYFEELLNEGANELSELDNNLERVSQTDFISIYEVEKAIKNLKCGKASGVDEIRPEMLKYGGIVALQWLHRIIERSWAEGQIPEDWNKAIIAPIYKKGNKTECGNFRGISLLSVPGKIYASILEKRIREIVECQLGEEQAGFRPNRGCQDQIFSLRQIIEKSWEHNKNLYLGFIDLEKAYDKVPRNRLFEILKLYGINGNLLRATRSLYRNCKSAVRIEGCIGNWFEIKLGVRQGCTLSPLLFIIYMDHLIKNSNLLPDLKFGDTNVSSLLYADDVVLLNSCPKSLQEALNKVDISCRQAGMKISLSKTKVMKIGREPENLDFKLNDVKIEQVSQFTYLGTIFSENGRLDTEIDSRISKAGSVGSQLNRFIWNKKEVSQKTKLAVYNSVFNPILTYGSESWVRNKEIDRRLETANMRVVRKIGGINRWHQWQDRISNEDIRKRLDIVSVQEKVSKSNLRWYGHVNRMGEHRLAKQIFEAKMDGKRPRGRPRGRWIDGVKVALESRGLTEDKARHLTSNRNTWRKIVDRKLVIKN